MNAPELRRSVLSVLSVVRVIRGSCYPWFVLCGYSAVVVVCTRPRHVSCPRSCSLLPPSPPASNAPSARCSWSSRARRRRGWAVVEVVVAPIGGGVAVHTGTGSPANKLAGLGFGDLPPAADLEVIEEAFARRQAPLQVEFASLGDPAIPRMLSRRGYELIGFENVLGLPLDVARLEAIARQRQSTSTAPGADETAAWMDAVATGFLHPDTFDGPASHESFSREVDRTDLRRHLRHAELRALHRAARGCRRRRREPQDPSGRRAARRSGDAARPPPAGRPDGAPPPSPARLRAPRLRRRGRHDATRIEVDGERPALRIRRALRARDPRQAAALIRRSIYRVVVPVLPSARAI